MQRAAWHGAAEVREDALRAAANLLLTETFPDMKDDKRQEMFNSLQEKPTPDEARELQAHLGGRHFTSLWSFLTFSRRVASIQSSAILPLSGETVSRPIMASRIGSTLCGESRWGCVEAQITVHIFYFERLR
jgi:hypothetical protein